MTMSCLCKTASKPSADEAELDEEYETERHLFYVACTRARDRLLVSGVEPASEFFADLSAMMGAAA